MVQTWNKFCFTGGVLEMAIELPGDAHSGGKSIELGGYKRLTAGNCTNWISKLSSAPIFLCILFLNIWVGLWPAAWLMGNLARATFPDTTVNVWPWSYDRCGDIDHLDSRQIISACNDKPGYGFHPNQVKNAKEATKFIRIYFISLWSVCAHSFLIHRRIVKWLVFSIRVNSRLYISTYLHSTLTQPHLMLHQGRGAPEIDIFEVMPGHEMPGHANPVEPFMSCSLQVAPGVPKGPLRPVNGEQLSGDKLWWVIFPALCWVDIHFMGFLLCQSIVVQRREFKCYNFL